MFYFLFSMSFFIFILFCFVLFCFVSFRFLVFYFLAPLLFFSFFATFFNVPPHTFLYIICFDPIAFEILFFNISIVDMLNFIIF
ncbi:hypothetical protein BX661DRAFT_176605, partial [Kickxella alabastrina]|uniref:uncharacterized protein n=1 Tax=Kickxella alabastrina TaxID=61397 RepID=UPI00221E81FC